MRSNLEPVMVTSPSICKEAGELFRQYFPEGTVLVWKYEDWGARDAVHAQLLSREWLLCISFYNDYIFSQVEIDSLGCLVNIHPALPVLRGRGYDTLPLINHHDNHGATLHFVTKEIDAGEIIEVISQPVSKHICYPEFRIRNQKLSLLMLESFLHRCRDSEINQFQLDLKNMAKSSGFQWSGDFVTSKKHRMILNKLKNRDPQNSTLTHFPRELFES